MFVGIIAGFAARGGRWRSWIIAGCTDFKEGSAWLVGWGEGQVFAWVMLCHALAGFGGLDHLGCKVSVCMCGRDGDEKDRRYYRTKARSDDNISE